MQRHKKLALLAVIPIVTDFSILAAIFWQFIQMEHPGQRNFTSAEWHRLILLYLILIVGIFICHLINLFFKTALIDALASYLQQLKPLLRTALKNAGEIFGRIFIWTFLTSTLGIFIFLFPSYFKEKKWVQKYLGGLSWGVGTFLVLPILILEKLTLGAALKKSSALMKNTYGDSFPKDMRGNLILLLLRFLSLIPLIVGIYVGSKHAILLGSTTTVISLLIISFLSFFVQCYSTLIIYNHSTRH